MEALLIGSVILILALVPFLLASRRNNMPTPWDYQDVKCDGNMAADRPQGNIGKAGEYQQQAWPGADDTPHQSTTGEQQVYPNLFGYGYDATNPQFTSKLSGDPIELLESTRAQINAHAELMQAYGYNQPIATIGSHPFLRDELSNPTESEPGNAEPTPRVKLPKRG